VASWETVAQDGAPRRHPPTRELGQRQRKDHAKTTQPQRNVNATTKRNHSAMERIAIPCNSSAVAQEVCVLYKYVLAIHDPPGAMWLVQWTACVRSAW
jgi:hypothetical protein